MTDRALANDTRNDTRNDARNDARNDTRNDTRNDVLSRAALQRPVDPAALGRVAVLCGGHSAEREVSLMSGQGVLDALLARGVNARRFDPAERPLQALADEGTDRAFIALHGRFGEDGTIQGALELLGIPYTGSGVAACAVAMDKVLTKRIWDASGLPTPRHVALSDAAQLEGLVETLGLPLILKPPLEGSSIGITRVDDAARLRGAWDEARRHDDVVMAEAFVDGRELTIAVVGRGADSVALPIVEIRAPQGNYDYNNKYFSDATKYVCPAELDAELTARVQRISVAAYRAIGCEGWGRVDIMLARQTLQPMLLEVNTAPGMTSHSLVPMAARALGVSYEDLVLQLAGNASLKVRGQRVRR